MKSKNGQKAFLLENTHADNKQKNIYNMAKIIENSKMNSNKANEHWFVVTECPSCNKEIMLRDDELLDGSYVCPCGAKNSILGKMCTEYTESEAIEKGLLTQDEIDNWDSTIKSEREIAKEKIINDIMSEFDFEKVLSVMTALNWRWAYSMSPTGVPTLYEIKETARNLLNEAYDGKTNIATGGFCAEYNEYEFDESNDEESNDEAMLRLRFEVDSVESYYNFTDHELKYY